MIFPDFWDNLNLSTKFGNVAKFGKFRNKLTNLIQYLVKLGKLDNFVSIYEIKFQNPLKKIIQGKTVKFDKFD